MLIKKYYYSKLVLGLCILTALVFSNKADAGVFVYGTRVIFSAEKNEVIVRSENNSDKLPALIQAWVENSDGSKTDVPFAVNPPVTRVEPAGTQLFKIVKVPSAKNKFKEDVESLFYFNLLDIPAVNESAENLVQFAINTRVKLFYRPSHLKDGLNKAIEEQISFKISYENNNPVLNVINSSAYYITLPKINVIFDGGNYLADSVMVPPKETLQLDLTRISEEVETISESSLRGNKVVFQWINDSGAYLESEKLIDSK